MDFPPHLQTIMAEAMGLSVDDIAADTAIHNTPQWDSLAHMRMILGMEEVLGRPLSPDDIVSIASAKDVAKILKAA